MNNIVLHGTVILAIVVVWYWQARNVKNLFLNLVILVVTFMMILPSVRYFLSALGVR
jgi:hypothetical protein